ncbi:MAG TPA: D-alanine--D-alanine ligase [Acidobacteriota bacterium]|nr:D-alanine--D-alanine ligase [Acidobacteriota bacterium]
MRVLVLAGGKSAERDVSLASGAAVSRALNEAGCDVLIFDPGVSGHAIPWTPTALDVAIGAEPPSEETGDTLIRPARALLSPADISQAGLGEVDVVFIALHGGDGEDGHLQALLDAAGVPYAGSGMLASALAMDKNAAKRIFVADGIPTPNWQVLRRGEEASFEDVQDTLGLPFIVKPNAQGSTVGLSVVKDESQWGPAIEEGFRWDDTLVLEEYISGRELAVSILGDEVLPVVEIVPSHGIYDYECKYTAGLTKYICPADLPATKTAAVQQQGLAAFQSLGCSGYGRVDFLMTPEGQFYCLEINTLPGMTALSLLPKAALAVGISFPELLRRICDLGMKDRPAATRQAVGVTAG